MFFAFCEDGEATEADLMYGRDRYGQYLLAKSCAIAQIPNIVKIY